MIGNSVPSLHSIIKAMKDAGSQTGHERILHTLPLAALALSCIVSFSACATSTTTSRPGGDATAANDKAAKKSAKDELESPVNWVLVSKDPYTFIPKGMCREASRGFYDGEWVISRSKDARWFIPKNGVNGRDRKKWESEALWSELV